MASFQFLGRSRLLSYFYHSIKNSPSINLKILIPILYILLSGMLPLLSQDQDRQVIGKLDQAIVFDGTPEEAADGAYLFCSPESNYISGQIVTVGGGLAI